MAFELPELRYGYDGLEPHLDARTMKIHHTKHHQGYTDKFNAAVAEIDELTDRPAEAIIMDIESVPEAARQAVRNNGGGYVNHSFFWQILAPKGGGKPTGSLADAIDAAFGSFTGFQEQFAAEATSRFGSGWAWLVADADGGLRVGSTANQDSPLMGEDIAGLSGTPIIGLDVWEHAYYLQYQNKRSAYIAAFWQIVDWQQAADNFAEVL